MGIFDSIKELLNGGTLSDVAGNASEGLQNAAGEQLGGVGDTFAEWGDQLGGTDEPAE